MRSRCVGRCGELVTGKGRDITEDIWWRGGE